MILVDFGTTVPGGGQRHDLYACHRVANGQAFGGKPLSKDVGAGHIKRLVYLLPAGIIHTVDYLGKGRGA